MTRGTAVLEHRSTAGDVDDHGVDGVRVEGSGVLFGKGQRLLAGAAVIVDCTATGLAPRDDDVAAVELQHARGGTVDVREHGVCDAAREQRDTGALLTDRRQKIRQLRSARLQSGQQPLHASQFLRQQAIEAERVHEAIEAEPLHEPRRREHPAQPVRIGKQPVQNPPLEPAGSGARPLSLGALHFDAERLDQPAVLDAGRTGGFTAAAVETQVEMPCDRTAQGNAAVGDGAHQVDAAARAVVFVARFEVRGAGGGA